MTSLASLVVSLGLDSAPYERGLNQAEKSARQFSNQVKASFIGNLGAGLAEGFLKQLSSIPGALKDMVTGAIDAADHLNDLSKKTGIAVETLGGIGFAAKQAGGDLETVANASGKLNRQLAEAASGNEKAGEAFKALGINVKDAAGLTKSADVIIAEVADKFEGYADGPEKAALAIRLFGKAGAEMIPLLNDGGAKLRENIEYFKQYSGVTAQTAAQADQFNDTLAKLHLLNGAFVNKLISELLPTFQNLADAFLNLKEKSTAFQTTAEGLATIFKYIVDAGLNVAFIFGGIGREIGAVAAQITYLGEKAEEARGKQRSIIEILKDPFGAGAAVSAAKSAGSGYTAISDAVKKDGEDAYRILQETRRILYEGAGGTNQGFESGFTVTTPKQAAPKIRDAGSANAADALLKKQLDGQIKLIELWATQRKDALAFANRLLDSEYLDGLHTLKDVQEKEDSIRRLGLESELKRQQDIIDAERAFARRSGSATDRADAANKIKEAEERKTDAILKSGQAEKLALAENARAVQSLNDAYNDLVATIKQQSGDDIGAAQIRIARQVREAEKIVKQQGGDPAVVNQYRAQLDGIAELADAQKRYADLVGKAGNAEAQFLLDADQAGKGEIETLRALGRSRADTLEQLRQMADAAQELADRLGTPAAVKFADDMALAFRRARAEVDPLARKFNAIFEDQFANAFDSFLTGAKTAKEAFKDFARSVLNDMTRIASQEFAKKLFGGQGGGGFLGALAGLVGLFGGGGGGPTPGGQVGSTGGIDFSGTGYPLASGTDFVPYDGFLAKLHKGERVTPAAFNPVAGGNAPKGDVHFNITNTGAPVTAEETGRRQTSDGLVIDVMLRAVANNIRGGGVVAQAQAQQFGLNRAAGAPKRS